MQGLGDVQGEEVYLPGYMHPPCLVMGARYWREGFGGRECETVKASGGGRNFLLFTGVARDMLPTGALPNRCLGRLYVEIVSEADIRDDI